MERRRRRACMARIADQSSRHAAREDVTDSGQPHVASSYVRNAHTGRPGAVHRHAPPVPDHQHRLVDARPGPRAQGHRRPRLRRRRLPRLLRLRGRARRLAGAARGVRSVHRARRPAPVRAGRGAGRMGGPARRAGVPRRRSAHRPASQGRARGRGGSLPVARRRPLAGQGGRGHRRHLASLGGAPRVHAGRLGLHDARGEPGRGRDRERPPLRADATAADAGRGAGRPVARRVGGVDARAAAPRGGPPRAASPPRRSVRGLRGLGRRRQVPARCGVARRPCHRDAAHGRRDGRRAGPGGG